MIALDLRGHGSSPWEPPWNLEQHVADVLEAAPEASCAWLGHSFGGRIAYEVAAAAPERIDRLVLLDPAIRLPPHVGIAAAENARRDRSYVSFAEGIDRRYEESVLTTAPRELVEEELRVHLLEDDEGRFRYRYCQSTVVAAYGEMTREPPPFEQVRIPTLLVLGETSYLPYDDLLDAHAAALGDLLEVGADPGGPHGAVGCARRHGRRRRALPGLGDGRHARVDGCGERVDDGAQLGQELRIDAVLEPLVGFRDRDGVLDRPGAERAHDLAGLRRRPDAAEHAGARREHRDRLVHGRATRRAGARPSRARS